MGVGWGGGGAKGPGEHVLSHIPNPTRGKKTLCLCVLMVMTISKLGCKALYLHPFSGFHVFMIMERRQVYIHLPYTLTANSNTCIIEQRLRPAGQ